MAVAPAIEYVAYYLKHKGGLDALFSDSTCIPPKDLETCCEIVAPCILGRIYSKYCLYRLLACVAQLLFFQESSSPGAWGAESPS